MKSLKVNLQRSMNLMKQQANRGRFEIEFEVGDWVLLKLQSYRQRSVENKASEKLSPRYFGPYEVVAKVGVCLC